MPLQYTGRSVKTINGENFQAKGDAGEAIVVEVSQEVIKDKGKPAALLKGEQKYAAGEVNNGKITVYTTDF